jgi:hypothetical protein
VFTIPTGLLKITLKDTKTNNSDQNSKVCDICAKRSGADEHLILVGYYPVSTGKK